MNALYISETRKTPAINFDPLKGKLEISGYRSMPEVAIQFYDPIINWVKEYISSPLVNATTIVFKLEYFNTTSNKCFMEIFKQLDSLAGTGHQVVLKWYFDEDDEDMSMSGDDVRASLKNIKVEKIVYNS
jgi:SiaC family regulatory phosphoprotein